MGNEKRSLMALVLAFVMALGMVMPVLAANGVDDGQVVTESNHLDVDETESDLPWVEAQATTPAALTIATAFDAPSNELELTNAIDLAVGAGPTTIVLTEDIALASILNIPDGANIILVGAYSLVANAGWAIQIHPDAELTLDGPTITRPYGSIGRGIRNDGTLVMRSGAISGHDSPFNGAGVNNWLSTSVFRMYGGTISNNSSESTGGGVMNFSGTFEMHGGTISGIALPQDIDVKI